jgi:hypothetical protein
MFLQLQAYWQQPVAFAPRTVVGGEIFTCHDLADLEATRKFLARKSQPLVYRLERDGPDISQTPVDLDELIAENQAEHSADFARHYRGLLRADADR